MSNNAGIPTGFNPQQRINQQAPEAPKKEGLGQRLLRMAGLAVDTKKASNKVQVQNKLDRYANNPMNVASERGLNGLQNGRVDQSARSADDDLLADLKNIS